VTSADRIRRCVLFFPASRPDRFDKAIATGADAVCMDLEDAVAPEQKDQARENVAEVLSRPALEDAERIVRINQVSTPAGRLDVEALLRAPAPPDAVMIPKVGEADDVLEVREALGPIGAKTPLIPLIETARGLDRVGEIAAACQSVVALLLGGVDLSTELGSSREWDALLYARSRIVHAAALAGVSPIDTPRLDIDHLDVLRQEASAARRLGFRGKAAIHPRQVVAIQDAFSPTAAEVERAKALLEAFSKQAEGVVRIDGGMVDRPVVEAARRVVQTAIQARRQRTEEDG
jgi:(S)-citramalyl-CoA lyase